MSSVSIKKAALITLVSKYSTVVVQLIINAILARLLTPEEFGIVSVVTVFIVFFTIIADMGVGPAIVQFKELNERDVSNIFIFTVFAAVIVSICFILFAYPLSFFYENKEYIVIGKVLAIAIFFNVLNIVPNALLLKGKRFKMLGLRTVTVTVFGGILACFLAFNGASYYALVINSVFVGFFTFVWNFFSSGLKIHLNYSNESIVKIKSYSGFQLGFNVINYFTRNLDNLLIGKFFGQAALGYYDKAYKLMLYPVGNLAHVVTPVLHPILSDFQNDRTEIYNRYLRVLKVLSLLGIFASVFCFYASKEIVLIMFGDNWNESIPIFQLLSISIWVQMLASSIGAIFQATGETRLLFKSGLKTTYCTIICIVIGILFGSLESVAMMVTIALTLNFFISFHVLITKVFNIKFISFLLTFKKHILIVLIMIIILVLIEINIINILLSTFLKLLLTLLAFSVGLLITKEYKVLYTFIKSR